MMRSLMRDAGSRGRAGMRRRRWLVGAATAVAAAFVAALPPAPAVAAPAHEVVVFAAASLKNALDTINAQYFKTSGKKVTISFAASSTLAKQIAAAAPADIFISADIDWMDYLAKRQLIKPATRSNLLGNAIVLIGAAGHKAPVTIDPHFDLVKLLDGGRLAMADPNTVPAGKYGKAALEKLGIWTAVSSHVAPAENVRAALVLVARGECPYGIVYRTDAAIEPKVTVVGTFPADTLPPIIYPVALTATSTNPDAAAFEAYLRSAAAKPLFEKQGFEVLSGSAAK